MSQRRGSVGRSSRTVVTGGPGGRVERALGVVVVTVGELGEDPPALVLADLLPRRPPTASVSGSSSWRCRCLSIRSSSREPRAHRLPGGDVAAKPRSPAHGTAVAHAYGRTRRLALDGRDVSPCAILTRNHGLGGTHPSCIAVPWSSRLAQCSITWPSREPDPVRLRRSRTGRPVGGIACSTAVLAIDDERAGLATRTSCCAPRPGRRRRRRRARRRRGRRRTPAATGRWRRRRPVPGPGTPAARPCPRGSTASGCTTASKSAGSPSTMICIERMASCLGLVGRQAARRGRFHDRHGADVARSARRSAWRRLGDRVEMPTSTYHGPAAAVRSGREHPRCACSPTRAAPGALRRHPAAGATPRRPSGSIMPRLRHSPVTGRWSSAPGLPVRKAA